MATPHVGAATNPVPVDRRLVAPSRVPIFFGATAATLAEKSTAADASLYVWPDCSLRDACELLWAESAHEFGSVLSQKAALSVSLVYPNSKGQLSLKALGCVGRLRRGGDDDKSLALVGYQPGDSLAVNAVEAANIPPPPENMRALSGGAQKSPPKPNSVSGASRFGSFKAADVRTERESGRRLDVRSERERERESGRGDGRDRPPPRGDAKRYSWRS